MGAQAITFCHLAAGRTDAVVCLKPSRAGRLRRLRSSWSASAASRSSDRRAARSGRSRSTSRRARASARAGTQELAERIAAALRS